MKDKNHHWSSVIGHRSLQQAGFSLIELLFAIVFITVIILGVVKLQTSNLTLSHTQKNTLQAHFLVSQGLEIVEGIGISSAGTYYIDSGTDYSLGSSPETIDELYKRSVLVETEASLPNAYKVTVTVSWEDSSGEHSVNAKRIIF